MDNCSLQRKTEILKLIADHPNWSVSTIQRNGGKEFKHAKYKKRWEEHIKRGGTRFEQWRYIDEYTYGRFVDARKELKCIKESNLKLWAAEAAQSFRDASFKFKASSFWIAKFKEKHSISSRKITKLVSKREVASMESILEAATKFQQTIKRISPQYPSHLVLNNDQVGFMYELTGNRTLSHTGEKLTVACATSPTNLATHSYTCQYVISLAGTIVGDVFLCLQERTARLSETVKKNYLLLQTLPSLAVVPENLLHHYTSTFWIMLS
ncbi:unnamed protein product [Orchesella dallaii]|uniref:HTH CENPB-type domain-containing protein n=1 Tax=Orchesella dallaii TaxID=48710 RepID=A0ABP1RXU3_9HEXA